LPFYFTKNKSFSYLSDLFVFFTQLFLMVCFVVFAVVTVFRDERDFNMQPVKLKEQLEKQREGV
jgi:hypothetical protein